jgi:hypothetical protein
MDLGKGMVKERVKLTSNPRRNAKPGGIATMVRKPLIRFDKHGSIQNQKRDKALTTHKVYFFISKFYMSFISSNKLQFIDLMLSISMIPN